MEIALSISYGRQSKGPGRSVTDVWSGMSRKTLAAKNLEVLGMGWTQEQSINFECAREVINDLMAIYTTKIYAEKGRAIPDSELINSLLAERSRLHQERSALDADDDVAVAAVRTKYNPIVRSLREEHREEWSKLV